MSDRAALDTDELLRGVCSAVAERLTAGEITGPDLRERGNLYPEIRKAIKERVGQEPAGRTYPTKHFPGVGSVDLVVPEPFALIELKWSYQAPGKLFECVWDAVKLGVLATEQDKAAMYIVAGASEQEWARSETSILFDGGRVDLRELWHQELVPAQGHKDAVTIGEYLVFGAWGNEPRRAPHSVSSEAMADLPVGDDFRLRVVRIRVDGPLIEWPSVLSRRELDRRSTD